MIQNVQIVPVVSNIHNSASYVSEWKTYVAWVLVFGIFAWFVKGLGVILNDIQLVYSHFINKIARLEEEIQQLSLWKENHTKEQAITIENISQAVYELEHILSSITANIQETRSQLIRTQCELVSRFEERYTNEAARLDSLVEQTERMKERHANDEGRLNHVHKSMDALVEETEWMKERHANEIVEHRNMIEKMSDSVYVLENQVLFLRNSIQTTRQEIIDKVETDVKHRNMIEKMSDSIYVLENQVLVLRNSIQTTRQDIIDTLETDVNKKVENIQTQLDNSLCGHRLIGFKCIQVPLGGGGCHVPIFRTIDNKSEVGCISGENTKIIFLEGFTQFREIEFMDLHRTTIYYKNEILYQGLYGNGLDALMNGQYSECFRNSPGIKTIWSFCLENGITLKCGGSEHINCIPIKTLIEENTNTY